jgi:hypothetical protein
MAGLGAIMGMCLDAAALSVNGRRPWRRAITATGLTYFNPSDAVANRLRAMVSTVHPNGFEALARQLGPGRLTWRGPALMLFARPAFAVLAQALVAAILALRGSRSPWLEAAVWLPVYGTLTDLACLGLMWRLTRREGLRLTDLVGFDRTRLVRDVLLGLALIPVSLVFILGGIAAAGWLAYGAITPPYLYEPLPLWGAVYGVLVFSFVLGLVEQMTYNGYLAPRLQVVCRSTTIAVALVAFAWSSQHVVMPLTFEPAFWTFRLLSPAPFTVFAALLYLRMRRLLPLAIAHALMDSAGVAVGVLWPLLRP